MDRGGSGAGAKAKRRGRDGIEKIGRHLPAGIGRGGNRDVVFVRRPRAGEVDDDRQMQFNQFIRHGEIGECLAGGDACQATGDRADGVDDLDPMILCLDRQGLQPQGIGEIRRGERRRDQPLTARVDGEHRPAERDRHDRHRQPHRGRPGGGSNRIATDGIAPHRYRIEADRRQGILVIAGRHQPDDQPRVGQLIGDPRVAGPGLARHDVGEAAIVDRRDRGRATGHRNQRGQHERGAARHDGSRFLYATIVASIHAANGAT